ncbi:MAG TPA: glucosaminidase domain-containing protein [Burkholderiaceae bacterium]
MTPTEFIAMMAPPARAIQSATGIPASFTIAQAAVESAWFNSALARQAFNLFGMKADAAWHGETITMPTGEYVDGRDVTIEAAFRKYPDLASGLQGHADFLTHNPRYASAFAHKDDACAFAQAVANAHYATDPHYAQTIISIIKSHGLQQYDKAPDAAA